MTAQPELQPHPVDGDRPFDRNSPISLLEVTSMLKEWGDGEPDAFERLVPVIYRELRVLASRALRRERADHTLQATALVNEVYLRLVKQQRMQWQNRAQFFGIAAQLMRRILVDHARRKQAAKRDGGDRVTWMDEGWGEPVSDSGNRKVDLIALDRALTRLQVLDSRQASIVELRYFAGLKVEETAEVLDLSTRTVKREWQMARAWLKVQLG